MINHKNYNFLACDWFKNVLFSSPNSLAKLSSDSLLWDSLLLDSLISQSHSSDFVNHSYDYRPNGTPLSPITIIYNWFYKELICDILH